MEDRGAEDQYPGRKKTIHFKRFNGDENPDVNLQGNMVALRTEDRCWQRIVDWMRR